MRPKILVFIDWYSPAYRAGGPIRSLRNMVEAIGDRCEFFVVTGTKDFASEEKLEGIQENVWQETGKAKVIYLSQDCINKGKYQEIYQEVKPDYIYLNSLFSAHFTLLPLRTFKAIKGKIVLAPRGMFGVESLKIKSTKKKVFLKLSRMLKWFDGLTWHATNVMEKSLIEKHVNASAVIKVAPNLPYVTSSWNKNLKKEKGSLKMVSISRIVPIKNILFLLEAMAEVKQSMSLHIIGPLEDESYWKLCLAAIDKLPDHVEVNYLGEMKPTDIDEYYNSSHLYCSPTLNENYGHSIVEALGFGLPVLLSQNTPWRELESIGIGYDLPFDKTLFAQKMDEFAAMDEGEFLEWRKRSRTFAEKKLLNDDLLSMTQNLFKS